MMLPGSANVKYVVLSDLHLGEADSILTEQNQGSDSVLLRKLVRCIEHVVEGNAGDNQATLVLNGDVLEMAFGSFEQALTNFEQFVEILLERELFRRIVYIPGNHDHHIWEIARETQYATALLGQSLGDSLPALSHVTSCRLDDAVPAYLLNKVFERVQPAHVSAPGSRGVDVIYPNLALVDDSGRCGVVIHHGHYVEPLYHFFSTARRWLFPDRPHPSSVEEVEEENFAWIDFVWSLLGRSGGAGADMRSLFRMLRNPEEFEVFAGALARRTAIAARTRWIPSSYLRRLVLKRTFCWAGPIIAGERTRLGPAYPAGLRHGIASYLFGPTYKQLEGALGRVPDELSFVFGHTHKPVEVALHRPDGGTPVHVYNTGGWPVDSLEPRPAMGASIVFLNEELDVAALRVYNDGPDGGYVPLDVRGSEGAKGNAFREAINRKVREGDGVWKNLAVSIRDAIRERRGEGGVIDQSLKMSLTEIRAVNS